jgi:hypothetical protein
MAMGLKQRTREEREQIVQALVPLIQRHAGGDLEALAATGSFATGRDGPYSDIELIAFVKRPANDDRRAALFIHDGILIDIWFLTRRQYIEIFRHRTDEKWSYVALGALIPLLNEPFIRTIAEVPSASRPESRLQGVVAMWPSLQEATGKVLNAVAREERDALPYLYWRMAERMCVALSLLNGRPFTTGARIFSEAATFPLLPDDFHALIDPAQAARPLEEHGTIALSVFGQLEAMVQSRGGALYQPGFDAFVAPLSAAERLRRRLGVTRAGRKLRRARDRLLSLLTRRPAAPE